MDDGFRHSGEVEAHLFDDFVVPAAGDPDQLGGLGNRGAAKDGALQVRVLLGEREDLLRELGCQGGVDGRGLDKDDRVLDLPCIIDQLCVDLLDRRIIRQRRENLYSMKQKADCQYQNNRFIAYLAERSCSHEKDK